MHWGAAPKPLWSIAGTFVGFLFVITLGEEFFFRGVLQQWVEDWTWNRPAALLITSACFGLAHLWLGRFPNWPWVPLAAALCIVVSVLPEHRVRPSGVKQSAWTGPA